MVVRIDIKKKEQIRADYLLLPLSDARIAAKHGISRTLLYKICNDIFVQKKGKKINRSTKKINEFYKKKRKAARIKMPDPTLDLIKEIKELKEIKEIKNLDIVDTKITDPIDMSIIDPADKDKVLFESTMNSLLMTQKLTDVAVRLLAEVIKETPEVAVSRIKLISEFNKIAARTHMTLHGKQNPTNILVQQNNNDYKFIPGK